MWNIELILIINFISSTDTDEKRVIHSKSANIEIMIYDKAHEDIKEIFQSLFNRHKIGLEALMKGSDFTFDCVNLLHYKCLQVNLKCCVSYIDSPDWIKNKTMNPIEREDKCFQYISAVASNHEGTEKIKVC